MRTGLTTLLILFGLVYALAQPYFSEVALTVGIEAPKTEKSLGNGTSFADFDGDGLDDITIGTQAGETIAFFRNEGGTFRRMPPLVPHTAESKQVLWVDYDNDGDKDLFVASFGAPNRLYQNQGGLLMIDVTDSAGLPLETSYTFGACWGDYNRDGLLDLYFGTRKDIIPDKRNYLYKNLGNGTFRDVSQSSNTADHGKLPFCSAFIDYNGDGWPDIYTANDKLTRNTLLLNNRNGTFTDTGSESRADTRLNAMCVAVGDFDNDGWQDLYISNTPSGNALLHNEAARTAFGPVKFAEIAGEAGVGFYGNGWGSNFFDADNDGDLDLYAGGTMALEDHGRRSSLFYLNTGQNTFTIPDVGMAGDSTISYSNSIGDFNNDGSPDILVQNDPPHHHHLWQNSTSSQNWIKIRLSGVLSNRDAVGAKVEVFSAGHYQMRYRHCGIGFMGQNSDTEIVGLGSREQADSVVITWPTGHRDRLYDIAPNQVLEIREGSTTGGQIEVDPSLRLLTTSARQESLDSVPVRIAPNPFRDEIRIEADKQVMYQYRILDLSGRPLEYGIIEAGNFNVDLQHLPSGILWLQLWDRAGNASIHRLLKQ